MATLLKQTLNWEVVHFYQIIKIKSNIYIYKKVTMNLWTHYSMLFYQNLLNQCGNYLQDYCHCCSKLKMHSSHDSKIRQALFAKHWGPVSPSLWPSPSAGTEFLAKNFNISWILQLSRQACWILKALINLSFLRYLWIYNNP